MPSISLTDFVQTNELPDAWTDFPILNGTGFTPNDSVSVVSLWHWDTDRTVTETFFTDGDGSFQNRVARTIPVWGLEEITVHVTDLATGVTVSLGPLSGPPVDRAPDYAVIAILPVESPGWLAVSPDGTRIYVSLGYGPTQSPNNGVSVINAATYEITTVEIPNTRDGGSPFSLSRDGSRLYVSTNFSITVVDTATHGLTTITMDDDPSYSTISPNGARLYVCTDDESLRRVEVLDIDPASPTYHTIIDTFDLVTTNNVGVPGGIAASSRFIYLAANDLTTINLSTRVTDTLGNPNGENAGVAVDPVPNSTGGSRAYLAVTDSNAVMVFDEVVAADGSATVAYQETISLGGTAPDTPVLITTSLQSRVYALKGGQFAENSVSVIAPAETITTHYNVHFRNQVFEATDTETYPERKTATFPVRPIAAAAAVSPDGYTLYVSNAQNPDATSERDMLSVIAVSER